MQLEGILEDQIKLRAFPFSLQDRAKDWFYCQPSACFTSCIELYKAFLEKFFPAYRIGSIRKEIFGIIQMKWESLYEYWERFNRLCASCPQYQISEPLLVQYFYEGLLPYDQGMIDAASGGTLVEILHLKRRCWSQIWHITPNDLTSKRAMLLCAQLFKGKVLVWCSPFNEQVCMIHNPTYSMKDGRIILTWDRSQITFHPDLSNNAKNPPKIELRHYLNNTWIGWRNKRRMWKLDFKA